MIAAAEKCEFARRHRKSYPKDIPKARSDVRAASAVLVTVPSPRVRGEGHSERSAHSNWVRGTLDRFIVGESPSPCSLRCETTPPSPRKRGEGTAMRTYTSSQPLRRGAELLRHPVGDVVDDQSADRARGQDCLKIPLSVLASQSAGVLGEGGLSRRSTTTSRVISPRSNASRKAA